MTFTLEVSAVGRVCCAPCTEGSRQLVLCLVRPMRAPTLLTIAILLSTTVIAAARTSRAWTYQEMFDDADLVVIGRFVATKDTDERSAILDLPVIGVLSEFETRLILKGGAEVTTFRLHHYRFGSVASKEIVNCPFLIDFPEKYHPRYLLFLRKEREGVYAPVTGQTDPAVESVVELRAGAD